MKNNERVKFLLKAFTVHLNCLALAYSPLVLAEGSSLLDDINQGVQMTGSFLQQMMSAKQKALQQRFSNFQMSSLQPQSVPSKYFPQCPVSQGVSNFPDGACDPVAAGDVSSANRLKQFQALAVSWESFFENLTSKGQNSSSPVGLQCLKEETKKTDDQLQGMINNLTAIINRVKKQNQLFKQNIKKIKEEMEEVRGQLYGNPTNQKDKNKSLLSEFSKSCQNYFGAYGNNMTKSTGLIGLRDRNESQHDSATKFVNDKKSYVAEVKAQMKTLKKEIGRNGLAVLGNSNLLTTVLKTSGSSTTFGSMNSILQAKSYVLQKDFQLIQKDLAQVGFDIEFSDLDGDFQEKYSDFSEGAYEYFKKEAVTDCVTGKGSLINGGLSTSQILSGLRSRISSGSGTSLRTYRQALKNILDSDAFIEDKLSAISKLDSRYGVGNIYVQVQNADAQNVSLTPYGLYQKQIELCEQKIEQDNTFSTGNSRKSSRQNSTYARRMAKADKAIKKALSLEREYQNELATALYNRVVNCEGIESKSSSCSLSPKGGTDDLIPSNENFCVKNANTCAQKINGCYKENEKIITKKQTKMQAFASQYNAQVSSVIANQEILLNQIKAQAVTQAEYIKQFLPGSNYQFPNDLFVELPQEQMVSSLGVALRGGQETPSFNDLERKLESLKEMLNGQRTKVKSELESYYQDQYDSMIAEKEKWSQLKNDCIASIDQYNGEVNAANAQTAETYNDALSFCQKYNAMTTNPAAGCGDVDTLYEDAMNISTQYLQDAPSLKGTILAYKNYCNVANNEGQNSSDSSSKEDKKDNKDALYENFKDACDEEGDDLSQNLRDKIEDMIPQDFSQKEKDQVLDVLNGKSKKKDLSSKLKEKSPFFFSSLLWPYLKMVKKSEAPSVPKLEETNHLSSKAKKIEEKLKKWKDKGICDRYALALEVTALEDCQGEENATRCYKNYKEDEYYADGPEFKYAIKVLTAIKENASSSQSGRIGEQLNATPCMAQQGNNGSMGFDISSFDSANLSDEAQFLLNSIQTR